MLKRIQNSVYARPVAWLLIMSVSCMSFRMAPAPAKVTLPAGTLIALETTQPYSSKFLAPGQSIDFRVRMDVKVDGKTVIAGGSIAKGQVSRVNKARGVGREGSVEVNIKSVTAVDGQQVILSGGTYQEGEDRQTLAIILGVVVCILFLTMKGKDAEIPAGYSVDGTVAQNIEIETQN